jgi:GSH-dependent disulfide-bond oxidoreductase
MLELYTSEPNTFFLKPLIALHEKEATFQLHWFDAESLEQLSLGLSSIQGGDVEAHLHLEREGPLLLHDGELISSSYFMLEYIAETLPGAPLLPQAPYDLYRARASAQFLGAHLGALVPVLGCAKYLAPRLAANRAAMERKIATIEPVERRVGWSALLDGTYTPQILATARERLKFPVSRVEATLAQGPWLAGPDYSIADIDAFAMLRVLEDLTPELVNRDATPRILDYVARISARPAVRAALSTSRSGRPEQHFVPGVEPSRWG